MGAKQARTCSVTSTLIAGAVALCLFVTGCSPGYYIRAGIEQARILSRREPIENLLKSTQTDPDLRAKLQMVTDVREFSKTLGMTPDGSYTQYASVDRDVLVWVLSAAPATSLKQYEWYFPFVGSVPYKGFFLKHQAERDALRLEDRGLDTYLRGSPAYSTLGWFDDPLLSTVTKYDQLSLAMVVFHEILHTSLWINSRVSFNETLASFVGAAAAGEFFDQTQPPDLQLSKLSIDVWQDAIVYANFLQEVYSRLDNLYNSRDTGSESVLIEEKAVIFSEAAKRWLETKNQLKTNRYVDAFDGLNNASLLAEKVYHERPEVFWHLYNSNGNSLKRFLDVLVKNKAKLEDTQTDPFDVIEDLALIPITNENSRFLKPS